jgi:hypothetical protein
MTSATCGCQAVDGPEASLGRGWPGGLGPDRWWVTAQKNYTTQPTRCSDRSPVNTLHLPSRAGPAACEELAGLRAQDWPTAHLQVNMGSANTALRVLDDMPSRRSGRAARRRGPASWATPRRGRSQGALGCGRLGLTRTYTCRKASSARRPVQLRSERATAAARPDTARRGWRPCTPDRPAPSRAPAIAGRRGPALAPGCAVSATARSLPRKPKRRHGQDTGPEARRALGAEHDGAARGSPRSFQQTTRVPALASASGRRGLGWPRLQDLAGKARRDAVHGETAARRAREAAARRRAHRQERDTRPTQGEGGGHDAHSGSAV